MLAYIIHPKFYNNFCVFYSHTYVFLQICFLAYFWISFRYCTYDLFIHQHVSAINKDILFLITRGFPLRSGSWMRTSIPIWSTDLIHFL